MLTRLTLTVLALIAVVTFADYFSSPVEPCQIVVQKHGETDKKDDGVKKYCSTGRIVAIWKAAGSLVDDWHDDLTAASTIVIAIFTIVLATVTNRQARLTKESIDLAQAEFRSTHRPRIRIHAAAFKRLPGPPGDSSDRLAASLVYFNFGDATATKIEVRGQIFAGANFALDVQRSVIGTFENILSGGKFRADIDSEVPISTVAASKRTGIDYHCIGWVAYWDANGLRRESGFLYRAEVVTAERWVRIPDQDYNYDY